jgi:hypothetical protein
LPLFKLDTSSESHPFYTGTQKVGRHMGGRVEKFRNRFGKTTGRRLPSKDCRFRGRGQSRLPRLPFFSLRPPSSLLPLKPADARNRFAQGAQGAALPRAAQLLLLCAGLSLMPGRAGAGVRGRAPDLPAFGYMA